MKEKREKRLNSEFRKLIYEIINEQIKDPELTEMFSITNVYTTADLKQAKVYVSVFSTDEMKKQATFKAICRSAGYVRREIGRVMHIRAVPEFTFLADTGAEYGEKIDKLLSKVTYTTEESDDENDGGDGDDNA